MLFELDILYIDYRFKNYLNIYEKLLGLGFSKAEIDLGEYRSDRLMKVFDKYYDLEVIIEKIRNTRLLQLISYVAQVPEIVAIEPNPEPKPKEQKTPAKTKKQPEQLSLF